MVAGRIEKTSIGIITPWGLTLGAAGHHTWHKSLHSVIDYKVKHFGIRDSNTPNWIDPVFDKSLNKRFQSLSPRGFWRLVRDLKSDDSKFGFILIFEGSLYWAFIMYLLSILVPTRIYICNLWPSSKYFDISNGKQWNRKFFSIVLKLLSSNKKVIFTVDTNSLASRLNEIFKSDFQVFPVPSSLSYRSFPRKEREHSDVLLNLREFRVERLVEVMKKSCSKCSFHISYHKDSFEHLKKIFAHQANFNVGTFHIEPEEYESYIDSFDHSIFLYQPIPKTKRSFSHYCASGRLLDVLLRRIPVSLPHVGIDWIETAREWGRFATFDFDSDDSIAAHLNHPNFIGAIASTIPPFTPLAALRKLEAMAKERSRSVAINDSKRKFNYRVRLACVLVMVGVIWSVSVFSSDIVATFQKVRKFQLK